MSLFRQFGRLTQLRLARKYPVLVLGPLVLTALGAWWLRSPRYNGDTRWELLPPSDWGVDLNGSGCDGRTRYVFVAKTTETLCAPPNVSTNFGRLADSIRAAKTDAGHNPGIERR
jgi:hypothetical protein